MRGEMSGMSKLNEEDVVKIKKLHKSGKTRKELAIEFGLGYSTIVHILLGTRWNHLK